MHRSLAGFRFAQQNGIGTQDDIDKGDIDRDDIDKIMSLRASARPANLSTLMSS